MNLIQELCRDQNSISILSTYRGLVTSPGVTVLKHGDREYQRFFYIISGTASFRIPSGKTITAGENTIVYLPHDCSYICTWDECEQCEHITVNFVMFNNFGNPVNLNDELCIAAVDRDLKYHELICKIHDNWIGNNILRCYSIFYEILHKIHTEANIRNEITKAHKAVIYTQNHYCEDTPIDELAKMCYTSPSTFRILFKKETGFSPVKYRNHLRLQKALSMLEYNDYSIEEIADILNFSDVYYFTKSFKKEFGITPAKYKKSTSAN